jgi:hypothetical protein
MSHKNALNSIADPQSLEAHQAAELGVTRELLLTKGPDAFAAPRELAVCHETGHVIVAALDGVTIEYVEVIPESMDSLGPDIARRARAMGFPESGWHGYTAWETSPYPSDRKKTKFNVVEIDLPAFQHFIRMEIGGICGELVLFDGPVPDGSSIDEKLLSQSACMTRARGQTFIAQQVWSGLYQETCRAIKRNESTARKLIAAFDHKDRLEGDEVHSILEAGLSANDNEKRAARVA